MSLCPRGPLAREQHSPRGSCAFARKQDHKGDGYLLDTLLTIYWLNFYLFYNTWGLVFPWYPPGLMLHTSLASAPMFCLSYIVENWLIFYQSGVKPDPPGGEDTVLRPAIENAGRATHQGGRRQHGAATSTGELAELGVAPRERSANPTNSVGLGDFGNRHRDPGAYPQNQRCPPAALTESADRGEEWPRHFVGGSKGANSAPRRGPHRVWYLARG